LLGLGTFFFSSPLVHNSGSAIVDTIGSSNRVDNLGLLGPEGGLACICIAGIPDLSVVPDLPYSISIHDIGLGGVLVSLAFRRRQQDLGRMATELMALVQDRKIRPTVAEQITLEAIPKALERPAEGHVRGKIVARVQS
jgi:NADPH:quinone reductase